MVSVRSKFLEDTTEWASGKGRLVGSRIFRDKQ
jgi:hypothetical protein